LTASVSRPGSLSQEIEENNLTVKFHTVSQNISESVHAYQKILNLQIGAQNHTVNWTQTPDPESLTTLITNVPPTWSALHPTTKISSFRLYLKHWSVWG
jgi:hypothetical protein